MPVELLTAEFSKCPKNSGTHIQSHSYSVFKLESSEVHPCIPDILLVRTRDLVKKA